VGKVIKGEVKVGIGATFKIDEIRRKQIAANHTSAHLLQHALRQVVGKHIMQKGSAVDEHRLRFDISHNQALTEKELSAVENLVNEYIRANAENVTQVVAFDTALKLGAMALFGEKYGDEVRLVRMGDSLELCAGTHVNRTGDIGLFKIVNEESLASGVRRIEAVSGKPALAYVSELQAILKNATQTLKCSNLELAGNIEKNINTISRLEKELTEVRKQSILSDNSIVKKQVGDITFIKSLNHNLPAKDLKTIVDELKKQAGSKSVVALVNSNDEGKISLVIGLSQDLTSKYNAVDLATASCQILGGAKAGGRPDMAQGGGNLADKIDQALEKLETMLA
jgi:alanyl-tRNA synthetase